jgi:octaprenyl-diphosphate synthase
MRHGTPSQVQVVREAIANGGLENIEGVQQAIESTGAIAYTSRSAQEEAQKASEALGVFPESPYIDALRGLAQFSVSRTY